MRVFVRVLSGAVLTFTLLHEDATTLADVLRFVRDSGQEPALQGGVGNGPQEAPGRPRIDQGERKGEKEEEEDVQPKEEEQDERREMRAMGAEEVRLLFGDVDMLEEGDYTRTLSSFREMWMERGLVAKRKQRQAVWQPHLVLKRKGRDVGRSAVQSHMPGAATVVEVKDCRELVVTLSVGVTHVLAVPPPGGPEDTAIPKPPVLEVRTLHDERVAGDVFFSTVNSEGKAQCSQLRFVPSGVMAPETTHVVHIHGGMISGADASVEGHNAAGTGSEPPSTFPDAEFFFSTAALAPVRLVARGSNDAHGMTGLVTLSRNTMALLAELRSKLVARFGMDETSLYSLARIPRDAASDTAHAEQLQQPLATDVDVLQLSELDTVVFDIVHKPERLAAAAAAASVDGSLPATPLWISSLAARDAGEPVLVGIVRRSCPVLSWEEYRVQHWADARCGFYAVVGKMTPEEEHLALLRVVAAFDNDAAAAAAAAEAEAATVPAATPDQQADVERADGALTSTECAEQQQGGRVSSTTVRTSTATEQDVRKDTER